MDAVFFEGISYNVDDILSNGLTEQEFIQRGLWEGKYDQFSEQDRRKLLKEAFHLIQDFKKGAV